MTASQKTTILAHMREHRTITALDALAKHGCFRLAARIKDLRDDGHQIHTESIEISKGKHIAEYVLIKEATQ